MRLILAAALLMVAGGCGSKVDLSEATLLEGRGVESLVLGTTSLSEARKALGAAAHEPVMYQNSATLDAPPLRLEFAMEEGGGEPVLHAVRAFRTNNPRIVKYEGKTSRGIGLLDPVEKMTAAYGKPDVVWNTSPERYYYYTSGVVFAAEHPSKIQEYEGPPPTPSSAVITRIVVTPPFEVLEHGRTAQVPGHQLVSELPPETTLLVSPW